MLTMRERKIARAWSKRKIPRQNRLGHRELRDQLQVMVAGYDDLLREHRDSEKTLGTALRTVRAALRKHRACLVRMRANNHHLCGRQQLAHTCPDETCENLTDQLADVDGIITAVGLAL